MPPSNASNSAAKKGPGSFSGTPFSVRVALAGVRTYQWAVRPMLAGTGACRFVPSCSDYAAEAIRRHGAMGGGLMALKRVMRCHPLGGRGFDPVS